MKPQKIVKKSENWSSHGKHNRAAHWYRIREYERLLALKRRATEWFSSVREALGGAP